MIAQQQQPLPIMQVTVQVAEHSILPCTAVQLVKPAPSRKEGLSGRWFVADRDPKVDLVLEQAISKALLKVEAPSATGKTSLMQKLCDRARAKGWGRVLECSAADCKGDVTINSVLQTSSAAQGLDWGNIYGQTPDSSAGGVPPGECSTLYNSIC